VLGAHPDLVAAPEANLFVVETVGELVESVATFGVDLTSGLVRTIALVMHGELSEHALNAARRWLRERVTWTTGGLLDLLTECVAPCMFVDKSPLYCMLPAALDRLRAARPDALVIHLSRHPATAIESLRKLFIARSVHDARRQAAVAWITWHRRLVTFTSTLGGAGVTVHVEDLVHPTRDDVRGQLCEWMDVSTLPSAIQAMKRPEQWPFTQNVNAGHAGGDPAFFADPYLRSPDEHRQLPSLGADLDAAVAATARILGYDD